MPSRLCYDSRLELTRCNSLCQSTETAMSNLEFDMHELTRSLHQKNDSKIVLLVADGLG